MNEKARTHPERHEQLVLDPGHELEAPVQSRPEHLLEAENLGQRAEQARDVVEQTAESAASERRRIERLERSEAPAEASSPAFINRELKSITLQRELQAIRRKLPAPERVLSRVIHEPAVRAISETAGKTVSRPSGLLGGGLVALLGTTGYLYMARHTGFRYNYLVFLILFAGGFAVGIILELLVWTATRSRRATD